MDYLANFLGTLVGDSDQVRWIITAMVALVIFVFALGLVFLVTAASDPARRRLQKMAASGRNNKDGRPSPWLERLKLLAPAMVPKKASDISRIRSQLMNAGHVSENALLVFFSLKAIFGVTLPVVVFAVVQYIPSFSVNQVIFFSLLAAGIGVFGPNIVLTRMVERRKDKIRRGFADALDLLVVCVEAGLGIDMAMRRIARELQFAHPVLAQEFSMINGEIRAGVERTRALRNLADRTGVDEVRGFAALLSQTIKFGSSVADTLRVYSEDFRDKRVQEAEEMAAKIGTKLLFPMIFCFFPSFFIIALGPAVLAALEALSDKF